MKSVGEFGISVDANADTFFSEKRQDMVEAFVEDHDTRRALQVCLGITGQPAVFADPHSAGGLFEAYAGF